MRNRRGHSCALSDLDLDLGSGIRKMDHFSLTLLAQGEAMTTPVHTDEDLCWRLASTGAIWRMIVPSPAKRTTTLKGFELELHEQRFQGPTEKLYVLKDTPRDEIDRAWKIIADVTLPRCRNAKCGSLNLLVMNVLSHDRALLQRTLMCQECDWSVVL